MRWLATLVMMTALLSHAADSKKEKTSAGDEDYQAAGILTRNCAICHQAADHPGALFLNQARLSEKATLDLIYDLLDKGQMPPAHRDFKKTKDGKTLMRWVAKKRNAMGK